MNGFRFLGMLGVAAGSLVFCQAGFAQHHANFAPAEATASPRAAASRTPSMSGYKRFSQLRRPAGLSTGSPRRSLDGPADAAGAARRNGHFARLPTAPRVARAGGSGAAVGAPPRGTAGRRSANNSFRIDRVGGSGAAPN